MKIKIWVIIFAAVLGIASFFYLNKSFNNPVKNMVYFLPGCFNLQPEVEGDIQFYGLNLSELCRERGLNLKVVRSLDNLKDIHKIIVFEINGYKMKGLKKYPPSKVSLFLWEPPVTIARNYDKKYHNYFSKIFTWNDSLVDNKKYFKFHYPELKLCEENFKPFSEKKMCTLISRNNFSKHPFELYSSRCEAISFFQSHSASEFDFFGERWSVKKYKSYKGAIPTKGVLKNYKFNICYENTKDIPGYVTEKIFDSFQYLCVPVYLGASNISDYVPENCYIDRRKFDSYEQLLTFLQNMTEEEYLKYQQNIRDFVSSEKAQNFSPDNFKLAFIEALK